MNAEESYEEETRRTEDARHRAEQTRREAVGTVADEAAKLLNAVQGWVRERAQERADATERPASSDQATSRSAGAASPKAGAASPGAGAASPLHEHLIADGSAACKVCPLCRLIAAGREVNVNQQTLEQLGTAAGSLVQVVAEILENAQHSGTPRREAPVQKIRLSDDEDDA